ncbi:Zn-ribbon domain-containing OB-fold protein [Natrinema salsiterrestre]|uniref:Zn-ribbon domain-containing OB-fold protein n=1 Tax=Natrinema salsiterrestre TaxID=2950540 RepID=A0A9Q4L6J3_9EURY|nr:Zn-ribbon domain-containing OB-fold protein [Natrinema salsiterrestre]MDF9746201.1 Zn-ribbon domain-containing OB-fold protein [Natrinema salsiterrestre]
MSWDPRPVPDVTPETERYWTAAAQGELLVRECQECGFVYHYPRSLCPDCFSEDVEWRESSGRGEVYSYSTARTMSGWPEDDLPLVLAYVELEEGPRLMTNVDADPSAVEIGTRVAVEFRDVDDSEIAVPVFVPEDG